MKMPQFQFDFKTRHAGIAILITIAVLAGLIILNILLGETDIKIDFTSSKLFTLSDETKEFVATLEDDVEILLVYGSGQTPDNIRENVDAYENLSSLISVRTIDPDRNPTLISRYSSDNRVAGRGSIIVISGEYSRILGERDLYDIVYDQQGQPQVLSQKVEQQITSAIAYVTSGRTLKIYEVTGHQEATLVKLGYGDLLRQANYEIEEISLIRSNIPDDADLLTIVGPFSDFIEIEIDKIQNYLENGGKLFLAIEYTQEAQPNLYELLERWDIVVRHGLILETDKNHLIAEFGDNPLFSIPLMADHEILEPLADAQLFPIISAPIGFRNASVQQRQLEYFPLLQSSEQSIFRSDLTTEESFQLQPYPGDVSGPLDIAVAVRQRNLDTFEPEGAALVALGSAATLGGIQFFGQIKANADMLLNMINWAVDDDVSIDVDVKSLYRTPLQINTITGLIYAAITIVILPLLCIVVGLIIWLRRRNR